MLNDNKKIIKINYYIIVNKTLIKDLKKNKN